MENRVSSMRRLDAEMPKSKCATRREAREDSREGQSDSQFVHPCHPRRKSSRYTVCDELVC